MASPLAMTPEDVQLMLAADVHMGARNVDANMEQYVFKRAPNGQFIINLAKTWEKLMLAARIIVAIENPEDVCVVSGKPYGQRAVYKFAQYTSTNYIANRYTPGTFTNQIQKMYMEPRLLIVTSPAIDHQPINEAGYVNMPVIAFCDTDDKVKNVDIAIPCNNKSKHSIAALYWLLAREVLRMRGVISRKEKWSEMVDLFIYRDAKEVEKQAAEANAKAQEQLAAAIPTNVMPAYDVSAFSTDYVSVEPQTPVDVAPVAATPATDVEAAAGWTALDATGSWGGATDPAAAGWDTAPQSSGWGQ